MFTITGGEGTTLCFEIFLTHYLCKSYVRNMIILSLLLGSTWLLAWLPYSKVLAYLHVLLNGLTGVYILGNVLHII